MLKQLGVRIRALVLLLVVPRRFALPWNPPHLHSSLSLFLFPLDFLLFSIIFYCCLWLDKFVEQRSAVHHRLAHLFCANAISIAFRGDRVQLSIIGHQVGMIHRDICSTLLEIIHRIASSSHDFLDQLVRLLYTGVRMVHKLCLRRLPLTREPICFLGRECTNIEFLHMVQTCLQFLFRLTLIPDLVYCTLIFRTEVLLQTSRPLETADCHGEKPSDDQENYS